MEGGRVHPARARAANPLAVDEQRHVLSPEAAYDDVAPDQAASRPRHAWQPVDGLGRVVCRTLAQRCRIERVIWASGHDIDLLAHRCQLKLDVEPACLTCGKLEAGDLPRRKAAECDGEVVGAWRHSCETEGALCTADSAQGSRAIARRESDHGGRQTRTVGRGDGA